MDDELNAVRIFFRLKKNDNISIENVFEKYDESDHKFQKTIDNINDRFGNNVIMPASLFKKEDKDK